jgi:hypothetical protein
MDCRGFFAASGLSHGFFILPEYAEGVAAVEQLVLKLALTRSVPNRQSLASKQVVFETATGLPYCESSSLARYVDWIA